VQIANAIANARAHESILSKQKIDRELQFAREIQTGFLPKSLPPLGGYEFWAFYQAAGMVGGDYYDVVRLPGGRMAVLLGDVSGKGVPAALFMAKVTSDARVSLLTHPENPAIAMTNINNLVCAAGLADKFITIALCLLEPGAGSMTIVNGGHMSPIVRRRSGSLDEPAGEAVTGLPIGVMEEYDYESVASEIAVGESFVLYSDGISEAMNKDNDLYTIERLKEIISPRDLSPKELGEAIIDDVRKHVNGHAQSDDMTLMIVRRTA
jgi:serine phosphatase RsbU (regulator of sigma subunit)